MDNNMDLNLLHNVCSRNMTIDIRGFSVFDMLRFRLLRYPSHMDSNLEDKKIISLGINRGGT